MVDLPMENMKSWKKQNLSSDGFLNDWDEYPIFVDQVGKPGNITDFFKNSGGSSLFFLHIFERFFATQNTSEWISNECSIKSEKKNWKK